MYTMFLHYLTYTQLVQILSDCVSVYTLCTNVYTLYSIPVAGTILSDVSVYTLYYVYGVLTHWYYTSDCVSTVYEHLYIVSTLVLPHSSWYYTQWLCYCVYTCTHVSTLVLYQSAGTILSDCVSVYTLCTNVFISPTLASDEGVSATAGVLWDAGGGVWVLQLYTWVHSPILWQENGCITHSMITHVE